MSRVHNRSIWYVPARKRIISRGSHRRFARGSFRPARNCKRGRRVRARLR